MKYVADKSCRENEDTNFMFNHFFFCRKSCRLRDMGKHIVQRGWTQKTIWCTRIACWITKATNTHTGCVISIAFHCNNGGTNAPQCDVVHTLASSSFFFLLTFCRPCISVFNQLDAQNLFHNKFYFMPLHVSSTCAHHQVKIALHSLWYHHTYR